MAINMLDPKDLLSDFSKAFYQDNFSELVNLYNSLLQSQVPIKSSKELEKFDEDSNLCNSVLTLLRSPDWDLVSDSNEIKVETRYSGADFSTRASVLVSSPMIETLSVISEVDLLSNWIHALYQIQSVSSPAKFKKLMKYSFWFPWPLTNRECLLEFSAYPIQEEQAMLILMRSPGVEYLGQEIPLPGQDVVRMEINIGCIFVQWIAPSTTKVEILVQANAGVGGIPSLLPNWLVDFGKKQIMYFLMDALRHNVAGFEGSEYQVRVRDKKEFYEFVAEVLKEQLGINL